MTDIINPYYEAIKDLHIDDPYGFRSGTYLHHDFKKLESPWATRQDYCITYSWSIPDPASLLFVVEHLGAKAVEMGAGRGYYAWMVAQCGVDIICYDIAPPDIVTNNNWCSPRKSRYDDFSGETVQPYYPVLQGTPEALEQHTDRTLFLCWPPMDDMASASLQHYKGNKLVYIGEGNGGCTAVEKFFEALEKDWTEIAEHEPLQWDGIHDYITVYERKREQEAAQ